MSPQHSNRAALLEGTLRCLERLPAERVTARAIAAESGANLASIGYHFGSKNELVTEAVIEGLDRWLDEIEREIGEAASRDPGSTLRRMAEVVEDGRRRHGGLARNFIGALARAQHDPRIRKMHAEGFRRTRPTVARVLGLGEGQVGEDAAGLTLALFYGLLFQVLLDPALAVEGNRMQRAGARLLRILPDGPGGAPDRSGRP